MGGWYLKCVSHTRSCVVMILSDLSYAVVDPAGRFLISASGNRGWHGEATRTVFVHDIKPIA
jgi:hypothetical protein